MATHLTKRVTATTMAISVFLLIAGSQAQVAVPLSEIKVTVVDQTGAVIADSEVVFKGDSKTIVSHAGIDGAVRVALPSGQYAVAASHFGFLTNDLPDFQAVAPVPSELKIVLKVGSSFACNPCPGLVLAVPTVTSDLPNVIEDEPIHVTPVQPVTKTRKSRSLHCLYLWKCSTS